MFVDRSVRYLSYLGGLCTSRVLNLAACAAVGGGNGEQEPRTLLQSRIANRSILIKHRVWPHEQFLFGYHTDVATKIVVPSDPADLLQGGQSFFVDQRGFKGKLQEIGRYPNGGLESDAEILQRIAELPSLDPFLVRGHLQMCGIEVPTGCLELSAAERVGLETFAAAELIGFVRVVLGAEASASDPAAARLVRALFVDEIGVDLEPFRAVLGLDRKAFARAIFAWRGFLYCKWQVQHARARMPEVLAGLQQVHATVRNGDPAAEIGYAKTAVAERVFAALKRIRQLLQRYDMAYVDFVENGRPAAFRDFLAEAPRRFVELGEKAAAITHMLTFWRCRFANGVAGPVDGDELRAMLHDFESGFALPSAYACAAATK